jgi:hypothetical protein
MSRGWSSWFRCCTNAEFQRRYNGFYRVRRGATWQVPYYRLMERSKTRRTTFAEALTSLAAESGRVEASFASKLVATLDPSQPIIDQHVLRNFGLRMPYAQEANRLDKVIELHAELQRRYGRLLGSDVGRAICDRFRLRFPAADIGDLKRVDLVLWQHRG